MADINGITLSAGSQPTVKYTITYTKSRPSNSQMTYNFTISCALGSSGSYINAGYALLCTMTVNGASNQVRIKANDGDNWSGTTPRVKYVSVTCSSTTANALQAVTFAVVSDGRMPLNSGVITNSSYTVTSSALITTACGAPTSCSVNQTIAEQNVTLSWSGAKAGTGNAISSYEIQYCDSSNNSSWGAWTALTTVNTNSGSASASVAPPTSRTYYRKFRVRTRGSAGASYYSGWKESTNSVRKNGYPQKPTSVTASPTAYSTENVTVSWSGASSPTTTIKGYQVASRTSTDNATWSTWKVLTTLNLSSASGTYTDTGASRTPGTYTQYGIWTIDSFSVYSGEGVSNSVRCNVTACSAPTSVTLSATIAEGTVTLSWSGASGGAGNSIASYEIQYSESSDGSSWGSWFAYANVTSTATSGTRSVASPGIRGYYRRYRIRTCGTAGETYYSPWKISSNTVQKNTLPTPPTVFTVTPSVYMEPSATLSWSGTVKGTSAIKNYIIQQSTSTDNISWGSWETVATVTTSLTYGSYAATPSNVAGTFTRYRICVTDSLNAISAYVISASIQKNRPPLAPALLAPQNNAVTYNTKSMALIQTQAEPDGHPQTIWVLSADGTWLNSADNPEYFSKSGSTASAIKNIFTDPEVEPGTVSITVECRDEYAAGASVTRTFTILPSPFEDITANETHVKASHIQTLRTAVNNVRHYFGVPAYQWSEPLQEGITQVRDWPYHILELRAAVEGVVDMLNTFDSEIVPVDIPILDWLPIGTGRPRADVMNQLRDIILAL